MSIKDFTKVGSLHCCRCLARERLAYECPAGHELQRHAQIALTDTGSGIALKIKDRIFDPFFTTRTSGEGSGLGLAIVKRIVEQHQGRIAIETEVGAGSKITVRLPRPKPRHARGKKIYNSRMSEIPATTLTRRKLPIGIQG